MRQTTRQIIFALFIGISSHWAMAQAVKPLELAAGAPERYIVVPGDTLWGIAKRFLKDPYRWGELLRLNAEELKNPHRILPGQVLVLDKSGASPRLQLQTVRLSPREYVEPLQQAITTIAADKIEPFLTESQIIDGENLKLAARVIAIQDKRVIAGAGDRIYVTNVAKATRDWQVFRAGKELIDPQTKENLGQEAVFLGTARQQSEAEPAEFLLRSSKQEIITGDYLLPAPRADINNYIPRAPATKISGQIIAVNSGVNFSGRNAVVLLNRGKSDGVEAGHVFAVSLAGAEIKDRTGGETKSFRLPDEQTGLLFVFRVFDRVAYAFVMESQKPMSLGDVFRTP